jgi:hypothetical protein
VNGSADSLADQTGFEAAEEGMAVDLFFIFDDHLDLDAVVLVDDCQGAVAGFADQSKEVKSIKETVYAVEILKRQSSLKYLSSTSNIFYDDFLVNKFG